MVSRAGLFASGGFAAGPPSQQPTPSSRSTFTPATFMPCAATAALPGHLLQHRFRLQGRRLLPHPLLRLLPVRRRCRLHADGLCWVVRCGGNCFTTRHEALASQAPQRRSVAEYFATPLRPSLLGFCMLGRKLLRHQHAEAHLQVFGSFGVRCGMEPQPWGCFAVASAPRLLLDSSTGTHIQLSSGG